MADTSTRARESSDRDQRVFAPCRAACPVHIDVPGYLLAISDGRFSEALEIVIQRNPLPSVCGRVCLRPCEEGCRRCLLDEPVAIAQLKRAAADYGVYPPARRPKRLRPEKVAVIGGGPAGLTAAYDLATLGMNVTIYEGKEKLGGMLRYGIPNYRLPDYALDRDIDFILAHDIEAHPSTRVGDDISLDGLRESNDAVILTAGLGSSRGLPIPGADLPEVMTALPYLEASAAGEDIPVGERVVVVGGGNVAMDVARTARRHGAQNIVVVSLENREQMPASEHEIHEAQMEGVVIRPGWGPRAVLGEEHVTGLTTVACTAVFDGDGRFAPTFDEGVEQVFDADTVIFAIGQSADIASLGLPLTQRGALVHDPETMRTPVDGVYTAGDCVCGPTRVIDAILEGHRAAAIVYRDLTGDSDFLGQLEEEAVALGKVPAQMASKIESKRRIQMERLEYSESCGSFEEVEVGYTEYEAAREAQRCLSCTVGARLTREKCASCLTCVRVCPHGVPSVRAGGYVYFDLDACHACGACVSQCPALALSLEGSSEEELSRRIDRALFNPGLDTTMVFRCASTPDTFGHITHDTRVLTFSCLLRVSERAVLEAFETGASHVVFSACDEENCRFKHAMPLVANREDRIRSILGQLGMDEAFDVVEGEPIEGDYLP